MASAILGSLDPAVHEALAADYLVEADERCLGDEEAPLVASAQAHALLAVALRLRDAQPGSTP